MKSKFLLLHSPPISVSSIGNELILMRSEASAVLEDLTLRFRVRKKNGRNSEYSLKRTHQNMSHGCLLVL